MNLGGSLTRQVRTTFHIQKLLNLMWYGTYLLTAIGLTPGGSSTVHIYTLTVHIATHWDRIHRTEHI
jgi:hypothetical protein